MTNLTVSEKRERLKEVIDLFNALPDELQVAFVNAIHKQIIQPKVNEEWRFC